MTAASERGSLALARTLNSFRHRDFRLLFFGISLSHRAKCERAEP